HVQLLSIATPPVIHLPVGNGPSEVRGKSASLASSVVVVVMVVVVVVVVILMAFLANLCPLRQLLYGYPITIRCYA
ncbi:hypothetical protein, partial [Salmonella sp. s51090]|uniref:hypothetical protein n=1 Tax=Salmonella sp. s51090 TaxID=3159651 RepID=UPI0039806894